jgi:F0F1-type ATP synthase delta subunit
MINLNSFYARGLVEYAESLDMLPVLCDEASGMLNGIDAKKGPVSDALVRFMRAVPRKKRSPVLKKFVGLALNKLGVIDVEVTVPGSLLPEELSVLTEGLRRSLGKNPAVTVKTDESLLGGARVIAGNRMIDYSIKWKISMLKQALREKVVSE